MLGGRFCCTQTLIMVQLALDIIVNELGLGFIAKV